MKTFVQIVLLFTQISLIITTFQVYLRINKIWKRKHEREVADSQSIAGITLLIMNCILWALYYIYVEYDLLSLLDTFLYLIEAGVFLLISTGLWVKGQARLGFWELAKQALNLERKEADYLIKRFFKPTNADTILSMLHQLAMIDNEMDPKEKKLLESFAKEWNIKYEPEKLDSERQANVSHNYMKLRKSLQNYLNLDPPTEQVAQLRDMVEAIIEADDKVTEEEELIRSELMGIINSFLTSEKSDPEYHVLIVPQEPSHENIVNDLLPDAQKINVAGGIAYQIGSYYSSLYADMICRQYQEIKLFTIVHTPNDNGPNNIAHGKTETPGSK